MRVCSEVQGQPQAQQVCNPAEEEQGTEKEVAHREKLVFSKQPRSWVWVMGSQLFIILSTKYTRHHKRLFMGRRCQRIVTEEGQSRCI